MKKWLLMTLMIFVFLGDSSEAASKKDSSPENQAPMTADLEIPKERKFPKNKKISPCENYYDYVCSRVNESFTLPRDKSSYSFAFSDSNERIFRQKNKFLQSLLKGNAQETLSARLQQPVNYYQSCINQDARIAEEKEWLRTIPQKVKRIKSLSALISWMNQDVLKGGFGFFDFYVLKSKKGFDHYETGLIKDFMKLPHRKFYEDKNLLQEIEALTVDFFQIIGYTKAQAQKVTKEILAFEKEYSKIEPLPEEWRKIYAAPAYYSKQKFLAKYPLTKFAIYLAEMPSEIKFHFFAPQSFKWIYKKLTEKPLAFWKNYYLYRALPKIIEKSHPKFYQTAFALNHKYFGGPAADRPDEEKCSRSINGKFSREIEYALLKEIFPDFSKKKFLSLLNKIRSTMITHLQEMPVRAKNQKPTAKRWISAQTKKMAIIKMKALKFKAAYPEVEKNWDFRPVMNYSKKRFLANGKLVNYANSEKYIAKSHKKIDYDLWITNPLVVNAYYSASLNTFVIPVGILQPPFYAQNKSDIYNLGGAGFVVGHEMGHAIDDKGSLFGAKGENYDWMDPQDRKIFIARGSKLDKFFIAKEHNADLTRGENISDLVGIRFAYKAAFAGKKASKRERKVFFEQVARVWCGKILPKQREMRLKNSHHAQNPQRVNIPLMQLDAFQETYQCGPGDAMYLAPQERVRIW